MIQCNIALTLMIPFLFSTVCAAVIPDLKSATLEIRGKIIPPSRVVPVDRGGHLVDDLIVAIQEDRLTAIRTTDGGEAWTTRFKDGRYLQLIAAERQMLFLQQCERRTGRLGRKQYRIVNPGEIQRVSTRDGKWLQPLVTGTPHLGKKTLQTLAVVTSTNRVFVLEMDSRNSDLHETQINSYRISCFTGGKTKPQWQKNYKSAGDVPSVGVGILFQGDPLYAKSKLKRLSIVGDILIACAGAAEDIIALNILSGEEKWRLPAVWEFQRGFIGPSVWQHFISRFGVDLPDDKGILDEDYRKEVHRTRQKIAEQKTRLAKTCRIVGGPVAVLTPTTMQQDYYKCKNCDKYHGTKPSEHHRVFVAVSEATGDYGGYLADCRVYEIDEQGEPIALINMPRMVKGRQFHLHDGGVIWRCSEGTVAKIAPSKQKHGMGPGPENTDCIGKLAWYVQPEANPGRSDVMEEADPHWLSWSKAGDPVAFDKDVMYWLPIGGYIRQPTDKVMHLPLLRCDLPAGESETVSLCIPFEGKAKKLSNNYSNSANHMFSYHPLHMSIVSVIACNQSLVLTVASEDGNQTMLFFELAPR